MKYVIILPDGAADEPIAVLDNKTPLQAANIPSMDWVAQNGKIGRVQTVPDGFIPATDVATLSLFGFDPDEYYTGRAPLEAAAQGITVDAEGVIFRCNFVTIKDGCMADFTAGHVPQFETDQLIKDLNILFGDEPDIIFHAGVSYRNLMIMQNVGVIKLQCQAPHDIPDQPIANYRPKGDMADRVEAIMRKAENMIKSHDVNKKRLENEHDPISGIWLWGQGKPTTLNSFNTRWQTSAVCITGVDIIRGIATSMDIPLIEVEGATGYIDTNYHAKGKAAVDALSKYDTVIVHIEAPDEAGHLGDANEKVLALERVDEHIVTPLLEAVRKYKDWRILIAPDHPTPVSTKAHSTAPPPWCYAGSDITAASGRPFTEIDATREGVLIDPGHEFISQFMTHL